MLLHIGYDITDMPMDKLEQLYHGWHDTTLKYEEFEKFKEEANWLL